MLFIMAGISFTFFDLGNAISGSLFVNMGSALSSGFELATGNAGAGTLISILIGGFMGLISILIFPIHWLLIYRPDEIGMAFAMVIPWILAIGISAALFAKSAREGIFIGLYLAIGYILAGIGIYVGITALLSSQAETTIGTGAIVGAFQGLTGLHPILAVFFAVGEGCLIGGIFGALIGSLKYKPGQDDFTPKQRKKKAKGPKGSDPDKPEESKEPDFPFEVGEY
jgi:hypothetical protein